MAWTRLVAVVGVRYIRLWLSSASKLVPSQACQTPSLLLAYFPWLDGGSPPTSVHSGLHPNMNPLGVFSRHLELDAGSPLLSRSLSLLIFIHSLYHSLFYILFTCFYP